MAELLLPEVWTHTGEENKELIGAGSYGTVYKVTDDKGNVSAVKIINIPDKDAELNALKSEMRDPESVRTYLSDVTTEFMSEIKTMQKLKDSKNIVRLKSYFVESNEDGFRWRVYIQMEYLKSLSDYFDEKKIEENDVIRMGIDLCHALIDCGKKNIIHRDIKPGNIMVDEEGNFKLGDFGIARHVEKTLGTMSQKGTFTYMAPEVFHGARYGKSADIYSLGLVLYRFLNNDRDAFIDPDKKLIRYKEKENALKQRMDGIEIPPPKNGSKELADIVKRAVSFKPEDRYQDAEDMLRDLTDLSRGVYQVGRSWADKDPWHRTKRFLYHNKFKLAAGVIAIACIAFGVNAWQHYRQNVKVEAWNPDQVSVSENLRAKVCEEAKRCDDNVWSLMKANDEEGFLESFPDCKEDDFEIIYDNYYMLTNVKENLGSDYDDYIDSYQNECTVYPHVVSKEDDTYFVEVCRYYIETKEEDYTNLKNLEDYYQGHLLQSSMCYKVDTKDDEINGITIIDGNEDTIFSHTRHVFAGLLDENPDASIRLTSDRENANFLFVENDFTYDGFFRAGTVGYFINEKDNTITFIIDVKNGMDQDVEIKMINFTLIMGEEAEDFPGDGENYSLNLWTKGKKNQCYLMTYPLKKTDEIGLETYRNADGIRIDFQDDLEGVK